jgi:hypothetical protein
VAGWAEAAEDRRALRRWEKETGEGGDWRRGGLTAEEAVEKVRYAVKGSREALRA